MSIVDGIHWYNDPTECDNEKFDLTYLSLGAGVQSTALLYMAFHEYPGMPKIDFAVFSDTGDEPQWLQPHINNLVELGNQFGIPVYVITKDGEKLSDKIFASCVTRFCSIPTFTKNPNGKNGMLRRQCTSEFKIIPIQKFVRKKLGLAFRQRVGNRRVRAIIGISTDEIQRMKPSRQKWVVNCYPLINLQISRNMCQKIIEDYNYPPVKKSACVYCPYHNDAEWKDLKINHPEDFEFACKVDKAIRDSTKKGVKNPVYLHRSCKPLSEVDFTPDKTDLFSWMCDGYCGL